VSNSNPLLGCIVYTWMEKLIDWAWTPNRIWYQHNTQSADYRTAQKKHKSVKYYPQVNKGKGKGMKYSSLQLALPLRELTCMPYGTTQCYMAPGRGFPPLPQLCIVSGKASPMPQILIKFNRSSIKVKELDIVYLTYLIFKICVPRWTVTCSIKSWNPNTSCTLFYHPLTLPCSHRV